MTSRRYSQLDVFSHEPLLGNPLAVVHDAAGLDDARMAAFARWTNLSETTFLLPPTHPQADYRLRIFTPGRELPFAGHPTLGSCHAWLDAGGTPRRSDEIVQECGVGLVRIRRSAHGPLAFAAPSTRIEVPEPALRASVSQALGLEPQSVLDVRWLDNGPRFLSFHLDSAEAVRAVKPDHAGLKRLGVVVGLVGPLPAGSDAAFEVRAFCIAQDNIEEDPVTGSLNAALAVWMIGEGRAPRCYVAVQGTCLGRAGRVHVDGSTGSTVWIGGDVAPCITGTVVL